MSVRPFSRAPRRRRTRQALGVWFVLALLLLAWTAAAQGLDVADVLYFLRTYERDAQIVLAVVLLVAAVQLAGYDRMAWHLFANATAFERPLPLGEAWVVDGDTVDDLRSGVRYRLANIDAPETGDRAKCFREHERGEAAKRAAIELVRGAGSVAVKRTWRTDSFGRRVAFLLVDGADLGGLLIRRGLARPWRGSRARWCGKNGGLAKIARAGKATHACNTCRAWR